MSISPALGSINTVPMAYEEMLDYKAVNVAYDCKRRPFSFLFSYNLQPFLKKVAHKMKSAWHTLSLIWSCT